MAAKKTAKRSSKSMKDLKPRKGTSRSAKGGFDPSTVADQVKDKLRKYGPYR